MVRHHGSCLLEEIEPETRAPGRHSAPPPQDNIDVSCTVQSISSEGKKIRGRRRVLVIPKDNIGIACLPAPDSRLDNIVELTEHESTNDSTSEKWSESGESVLPQETMVRARSKMHESRGEVIEANQSTTSSNESELIIKVNPSFERSRSCKRRDTIGLLWQETGHEAINKCDELKKPNHKFQEDIGISNIRRPKNDPMKPRKPILPRDNIGLGCKPSNKSGGRLSGSKLSNGFNIKNSTNAVEKKHGYQGRLHGENTRKVEKTREQSDTLRTVSKLSVLLLYIHFLLTYYLSFAKSHRYAEIFDSCPSQDVYE